MEISKLINDNYYLVQVKYPTAQDCSDYYISDSEEIHISDSEEEIDRLEELVEECLCNYAYIDKPLEEDFEDPEAFTQEYDGWYENTRNSIEIIVNKITPQLVKNFGENFFENLELL